MRVDRRGGLEEEGLAPVVVLLVLAEVDSLADIIVRVLEEKNMVSNFLENKRGRKRSGRT